jgi:uncharacterized DUF497 family protein
MNGFVLNIGWNERKAESNRVKHGISFELAASVFSDPHAATMFDEDHSQAEDRWITIGHADNGVLLVVIHTWEDCPPDSANARIISARRATSSERSTYEEEL